MSSLTARAFCGDDDVTAMGALITHARPRAWQSDYPAAHDLRELLTESSVQAHTRLWHDAHGALVAYALVDESNNLLYDVLPAARDADLDAEIFAWGEDCLRQRNAASDEQNTLDVSCRVEDAERLARLERFGFVRQTLETIHMTRDLREPIGTPQLPAGFSIRSVAGEHEAEALAALHRAAFGTDYLTTEKRLVWMRAPNYDPALDLAVATDGALAAYCFGHIERETDADAVGWLDPLATHPRFQGRGLARALLLYGLQELRLRGMDCAALGTSSENIAMQRAAFAAGFCVESKRAWFSKII